LVLISGGVDSATALFWAKQNYEVTALSIDYFTRPQKEKEAVRRLTNHANIPLIECELPFLKSAKYLHQNQNFNLDDVPDGYIPTRNLLFYAISAHYAEILGISNIIGGHLLTDAEDFPDAREEFFVKLQDLLWTSKSRESTPKFQFIRPFTAKSKYEVINMGLDLKVPYELTWTCFKNGESPCGECDACLARKTAFRIIGINDPALIHQFHKKN